MRILKIYYRKKIYVKEWLILLRMMRLFYLLFVETSEYLFLRLKFSFFDICCCVFFINISYLSCCLCFQFNYIRIMYGYKVFYYAFKRIRKVTLSVYWKVTLSVYWVDLKILVFFWKSLFILFYEYFRLMDIIFDLSMQISSLRVVYIIMNDKIVLFPSCWNLWMFALEVQN